MRPQALAELTPPWERARIVSPGNGVAEGSVVELAVGPLGLRWRALHSDIIPGRQFRDTQITGPFAFWEHTHRFIPDGAAACWMEDDILYRLPFGFLGRVFGGALVARKVERMFAYRHQVLLRIFGG